MTRSRAVDFGDIEAAVERIDDETVVKPTPVERSTSLGEMVSADVRLKMEHLQWTGSFKTRGAYNKISKCVEQEGIEHAVAASAGNHAQGVARAATTLGIDSTVVMPKTAPQTKIDATRDYGAAVELHGRDFQAAMRHARSLAAENENATFIHAYDDPDIVAGQGTLGVEMAEDYPELDTVIVPIGGGGLISGISIAFAELQPDVRVIGVQAEHAATVPESLDKGEPMTLEAVDTIADGIATGGVSELTLGIISEHVDEVVTVSDDEIAYAILLLLERAKQLVEGAGAASVAAMLSDAVDVRGEIVMPLLGGGNLDMPMLRTVLVHAMTDREQLLHLRVKIDDVPGRMAELSGIMSEHEANIRTVRHERAVEDLRVGEAYLVFEIVTSGSGHSRTILESIQDHGYDVAVINRR